MDARLGICGFLFTVKQSKPPSGVGLCLGVLGWIGPHALSLFTLISQLNQLVALCVFVLGTRGVSMTLASRVHLFIIVALVLVGLLAPFH